MKCIATRIGLLLRERLGNTRAESNDVRNAHADIGPVSPRLRSGLGDGHVAAAGRTIADNIRLFGWLAVRVSLHVAIGLPILALALVLARYQLTDIDTSLSVSKVRAGHLHDAFLRWRNDSSIRVLQVCTAAGATIERPAELRGPFETRSGVFAVVPAAVLHHEAFLDVEVGAGCVFERANELAAAFLVRVGRGLDHHGAAIVGLLDIDVREVRANVFESAGPDQ